MGKLLWWLTVTITCVWNSLDPFVMEEIPFHIDSYYTSTLGVDDPAAIYRSFFGGSDLYQPCNPKKKDLSEYMAYSSKYNLHVPGYNETLNYILALPEGHDSDKDMHEYEIPEGELVPILAPISLQLQTSPEQSNFSTYSSWKSVGYNGKEYEFTITGMECWYCCIGHEKFDGTRYQHQYVTKDDFNGVVYSAGTVLGLANSETRISIKCDGLNITFDEFFGDGTQRFKTFLDGNIKPTEEEAS